MPTAAAQRLLRDRQILMVALTNQTSRAAGLHRGTDRRIGRPGRHGLPTCASPRPAADLRRGPTADQLPGHHLT